MSKKSIFGTIAGLAAAAIVISGVAAVAVKVLKDEDLDEAEEADDEIHFIEIDD